MRRASDDLPPAARARKASAGFTLLELISVMTIMAIVASSVAVFLRVPVQTYEDTERRAALTDAADTAFNFIRRDLQTALPNSIRVTSVGAVFYLEFLKTRTGGRYRAAQPSPALSSGPNTCPDGDANGLANENVMQFGIADTCLTTLGTLPDFAGIVPGADFLVVFNLGGAYGGADAYVGGAITGGNKSLITAARTGAGGENVLEFESNVFNLESPARRFDVVSGPVTYVCDPGAGALRRVSAYSIAAVQPTPPTGTSATLAQRVTGCTLTYDQNVTNQRNGVVSIWLRTADPSGATTVTLFQQIHVGNSA